MSVLCIAMISFYKKNSCLFNLKPGYFESKVWMLHVNYTLVLSYYVSIPALNRNRLVTEEPLMDSLNSLNSRLTVLEWDLMVNKPLGSWNVAFTMITRSLKKVGHCSEVHRPIYIIFTIDNVVMETRTHLFFDDRMFGTRIGCLFRMDIPRLISHTKQLLLSYQFNIIGLLTFGILWNVIGTKYYKVNIIVCKMKNFVVTVKSVQKKSLWYFQKQFVISSERIRSYNVIVD